MIETIELNIPLKVKLSRGEIIDTARNNRRIPYKLYMPEGGAQKKPLVFWSHGLGGSRDGAGFISRYLAENDFAVLHIQHIGTDTSLWEGKDGHPWDIMRKAKIPREASLDRFRDVPFVLDQIHEIEGYEYFDMKALGMSGHSFGALTTQVIGGQLFPDENNNFMSFADDRFNAGILYSFVPMGHLYEGNAADLFAPMKLPMLYMTGTQDDMPIEGLEYTNRMPVYEQAGSKDKHLLIIEDGDHMVFTGSRGKLKVNPLKDVHEKIIKELALAYWTAYLKDHKHTHEWLQSGGAVNYLGNHGTYKISKE